MARDRALVTLQAVLGVAFGVAWLRSFAAVGWVPHTISVGLIAGGVGLGLGALWALRRSFRVAPTPRNDGVLVTDGIYRRFRHPMYTAVLLLIAGCTLVRPDLPVLGLAVANLALYVGKARYEEGLLLAHYPDYAAYRRRTLGVLPGL